MIVEGWTSERPKEEGFYWFYGRTGTLRNAIPDLTIAKFAYYSNDELMCHIGSYSFYEWETLGFWKKIEAPNISPALTTALNNLNDARCVAEGAKCFIAKARKP